MNDKNNKHLETTLQTKNVETIAPDNNDSGLRSHENIIRTADLTQSIRNDELDIQKVQQKIAGLNSEGLPRTDEQPISKQQIIDQYKQHEINPQKPSLLKVLKWGLSSTDFAYNSKEQSAFYDQFSRYYLGRERLARLIGLKLLESIPGDPKDAFICERAAGTGIVTEALVDAGFHVRASDLNESQLGELSERLPNVETVIEDLNGEMPGVANNSVDAVLQVGAERYMTSAGKKLYVQEAQRVLKDNGLLLWVKFPGEAIQGVLKHGWKWPSSIGAMTKIFEENGFKVISNESFLSKLNFSAMGRLLVVQKQGK